MKNKALILASCLSNSLCKYKESKMKVYILTKCESNEIQVSLESRFKKQKFGRPPKVLGRKDLAKVKR